MFAPPLVLALPVLALLAAPAMAAPCTPSTGRDLSLEEVVSGLRHPTAAVAPEGDPRLFIVEQGGTVRVLEEGRLRPKPFLDLRHYVTDAFAEQGLYSLLFHPRYAENGRLFVTYTERDFGDLVLAEYRVDPADPNRALSVEKRLLRVPQPTSFHQAGGLAWGPGGLLWMGVGDGGTHGNTPSPAGQDRSNLRATMLRLDVDGGSPYAVPPDNPFLREEGVRPEIAHYGLRNPWRFDFDPVTGHLWIADTGHYEREEVNRVRATELGHNFGWAVREGGVCRDDNPRCGESFTEPFFDYPAGDGCNGVIGGYVYRGACLPAWQGAFFYADFCNRFVRAAEAVGDKPKITDLTAQLDPAGDRLVAISSFGRDGAGELYVLSHLSGTVYRIVAR